jgi:hypothetical protein
MPGTWCRSATRNDQAGLELELSHVPPSHPAPAAYRRPDRRRGRRAARPGHRGLRHRPDPDAGREARKAAEAQKTGGKDLPRGGVAAGEAPAQDDNTGTLIGSATGALLLAGAGTYVLRRRSTARREG